MKASRMPWPASATQVAPLGISLSNIKRQSSFSSRYSHAASGTAESKVGYHTRHHHVGQHALRRLTKANLLSMKSIHLLILFMMVNALCVIFFAVLYYAAGGSCYALSSDFSFEQMLWLSVHVFTTVGFGTDSPACAGPQLLVFFEHFVGLIDIALFTAIILSKLLQPSPMVRFSKKFLICDEADGKWLTFRMVRESPYQLRDCVLSVQCGLVSRENGEVAGCSEEALKLQCSMKSNLETWFVRHRIDESSPLHEGERIQDLAYMNVTLTVFDTAFIQEVRLYHNYTPATDVVYNARFDTMKSWEMSEAPRTSAGGIKAVINQLEHSVDHSKLDAYHLLV